MISITAPRSLVDRKNLVPGNRKHNTINPMPHGLYSVTKIVISVIIEMFLCEYFAFEFNIFDKGVGFDIIFVFEEDVVLNFHNLRRIENTIFFYQLRYIIYILLF